MLDNKVLDGKILRYNDNYFTNLFPELKTNTRAQKPLKQRTLDNRVAENSRETKTEREGRQRKKCFIERCCWIIEHRRLTNEM